MPIEILMPALSPTMTEGNLAKWSKKEGDKIKAGAVIAEIETDKATMEVEAVDEGTLGRILVPEGTQGVKVNQVIALMLKKAKIKRRWTAISRKSRQRLRRLLLLQKTLHLQPNPHPRLRPSRRFLQPRTSHRLLLILGLLSPLRVRTALKYLRPRCQAYSSRYGH